jgi:hypothetical protein
LVSGVPVEMVSFVHPVRLHKTLKIYPILSLKLLLYSYKYWEYI